MTEEWTEADDAVEEVREIRRRISARFGHDPLKLGAYYRAIDQRFRQRLAEPQGDSEDLVRDLREIERQLWAEFDNDPEKLAAHFMGRDRKLAGTPSPAKKGRSAA